jgi:hypothetical protein
MVVSQHATESLIAEDLALGPADFISRIDDLSMIVFQELADSSAKHLLAKEDHSFQRFFLQTQDEKISTNIVGKLALE